MDGADPFNSQLVQLMYIHLITLLLELYHVSGFITNQTLTHLFYFIKKFFRWTKLWLVPKFSIEVDLRIADHADSRCLSGIPALEIICRDDTGDISERHCLGMLSTRINMKQCPCADHSYSLMFSQLGP